MNQDILKDQGYLSVQTLPKLDEDSAGEDILSAEDSLKTKID